MHNHAMYEPPHFKSSDRSIAAELMRQHPFASLISVDDSGLPFVSNLPLVLEDRGGEFVLLGHCARANPHWRMLQAQPVAVVTFMGPQAYLSPRVYRERARVPSWNYLAVHCTVEASLVDDPEAKDQLLKKLIAAHEPAYADQWRSLAPEYTRKMLAGIVGFELRVSQLQCKLKLSQNRPESHAALRALYAAGDDNHRALAGWMDKLGLHG